MNKNLKNRWTVFYNSNLSGPIRDLPDVDLSDHGALAYDRGVSGPIRDLPDADLSDHGALAYDRGVSGPIRDLPDVDLSDHGALAYTPKTITWGTNDEELIKQINILMHASYSPNYAQVIPLLNSESLAKIVDYRYRQVINILDNNRFGLPQEEKTVLGTQIYMDFLLIDNMILSNPNCLQAIFNPSLYAGEQNLTDIFGVLKSYEQYLNEVGIQIPLINGQTGQLLTDSSGKYITAQGLLDYLMAKNQINENSDGKGL